MKYKFLIPIVLSVITGFLVGNLFFYKYDSNLKVASKDGSIIYFIEKNTYPSIEEALSKKEPESIILLEEDIYHEYIGATKILDNAKKIKELYNSQGNNIYIKEKLLDSRDFLNIVDEYDLFLSKYESYEEIGPILKSICLKYKELLTNEN